MTSTLWTDDTTTQLYPPTRAHNSARLVLASWWQGDTLPILVPVGSLRVSRARVPDIAPLNGISVQEVLRRQREGHRCYVAWFQGVPVAYGWSATQCAAIGEIGCRLALSAHDRYLWDFATAPAWRGRGIYPRLLQSILAAERTEAARFWIAYLPRNSASARGIARAGFRTTGAVMGAGHSLRFESAGEDTRGRAGSALLGLRQVRGAAEEQLW